MNNVICELCNIKFPEYIRHKEKLYILIDLEENYLKIDKIANLDIKNEFENENYRYIIKFNKNDNNNKIENGVENI